MTHFPFSGVMTAIITPFLTNGDLDFPAFHKLLEAQSKSGIHGVVVLGTTGENPTLTEKESEDLILAALNHQTDSFHIYVGTGTNDTKITIERSIKFANIKSIHNHKPNGIMIVTPYYNKPNQEHLFKHFSAVCKAIDNQIPICLYNVPSRTGTNLLPSTFIKICAENNNVVAIKEASGNVNLFTEMRNELNRIDLKNIRLLSGDDASFVPSLLCGCDGIISVTSHIIPTIMLNILNAYKNSSLFELMQLHLKTYEFNLKIFSVPNPVGIKWMLAELNMCSGVLRAPLYAAEELDTKLLRSLLDNLKQNGISLLKQI